MKLQWLAALVALGLALSGCRDAGHYVSRPEVPSYPAPSTPAQLFLNIAAAYGHKDLSELALLRAPDYAVYIPPQQPSGTHQDTLSASAETGLLEEMFVGTDSYDLTIQLPASPTSFRGFPWALDYEINWRLVASRSAGGQVSSDSAVYGRCEALVIPVDSYSGAWRLEAWIGPPPASLTSQRTTFQPRDDEPVLVKKVEPVYPPQAQARNVHGKVSVNLLVDQEGNVASVVVTRSVPELDQAVVAAVRQWLFKPGMLRGKPVPVWVAAPVSL